jgi:hypothetical protein
MFFGILANSKITALSLNQRSQSKYKIPGYEQDDGNEKPLENETSVSVLFGEPFIQNNYLMKKKSSYRSSQCS